MRYYRRKRSNRRRGKFYRRPNYRISKRFSVRRVLKRRPLAPEVKFVDKIQTTTAIAGASQSTFTITPTKLPRGTDEGTRIGNEVKCRRALIHLEITATNNVGQVILRGSDYVRVILWTSRVDSTISTAYMSALAFEDIIDYNQVTIVKDFYQPLGYFYVENSTTGTGAPTSFTVGQLIPSIKHYTWKLPFPRTAKFSNTGTFADTFNVDKDVMWCTLINDMALAVNYRYTSRITYCDN